MQPVEPAARPARAMPPTNHLLLYSGAYTLVQALFQFLFSVVAVAQYFCVFDFLRTYPVLIYIRILYFHNPRRCGSEINVGGSIDELADQAFVYLPSTPHVTTRALIFTSISLAFTVFWVVASIILIKGSRRQLYSNHAHWPWIVITFLISLLDMVGVLAYANDTFHTTTLNDLLDYVNGTASGFGNMNPSTAWAAWTMVILHARFGLFLLINVALIVFAIIDCSRLRTSVTASEIVRTRYYPRSPEQSSKVEEGSDETTSSTPSERIPKIPRPGLSQSYRTMKDFLFGRSLSTNSLIETRNRNRVNFLQEETTSSATPAPPSNFENLIAEQQRRLRGATVDTAGAARRSPAQASRSLPQLHNVAESSRGGRGTAGQLPSQMPWSYIGGTPANRMRDQLPPDEDLPPVPLPDYTAFQSHRKASVHRAASSLSSLTQKKDYSNTKSSHPGSTQVDVLY